MNAYASVDMLKDALNIAGAGDDARLLRLIEAASRAVDGYCNRHFYALRAAKLFDGDGGTALLTPDIIKIEEGGLRTDAGLDGTFETTWPEPDYLLLPGKRRPGVGLECGIAALHAHRGGEGRRSTTLLSGRTQHRARCRTVGLVAAPAPVRRDACRCRSGH